MRNQSHIVCAMCLCCLPVLSQTSPTAGANSGRRIVIAASAMFDGRGRIQRDTRIVVEGSSIVAINSKAGPVDYELRGMTVLPGWIDTHVHITWSFGADRKNAGMNRVTQEAAYQTAANAYATLMAGFT